jgi:predicted transcriptional regulator
MTKLEIMLPDAVSGAIETLARQTGQSQEDIITRAVEAYVEGRARWQADMERALDDVERDLGHDGEAVLAWMEGDTARLETSVASHQI